MANKYRMSYDPEYHENRGKPFTTCDLAYMCSMWESMKKQDIALALGRTHGAVLSMADRLRKSSQFDQYKKRGG